MLLNHGKVIQLSFNLIAWAVFRHDCLSVLCMWLYFSKLYFSGMAIPAVLQQELSFSSQGHNTWTKLYHYHLRFLNKHAVFQPYVVLCFTCTQLWDDYINGYALELSFRTSTGIPLHNLWEHYINQQCVPLFVTKYTGYLVCVVVLIQLQTQSSYYCKWETYLINDDCTLFHSWAFHTQKVSSLTHTYGCGFAVSTLGLCMVLKCLA